VYIYIYIYIYVYFNTVQHAATKSIFMRCIARAQTHTHTHTYSHTQTNDHIYVCIMAVWFANGAHRDSALPSCALEKIRREGERENGRQREIDRERQNRERFHPSILCSRESKVRAKKYLSLLWRLQNSVGALRAPGYLKQSPLKFERMSFFSL